MSCCDHDHTKVDFKKMEDDIVVCRCEEISKGEIVDALNSPLPVPTVDGIKRRLRPGMGRCQGGFCMPLVMDIIAEHEGVSLSDVRKAGSGSIISYGFTKGETDAYAGAAGEEAADE